MIDNIKQNAKPNLKLTTIEATAVAWAIASEGYIGLICCKYRPPNKPYQKRIQPVIEIANNKYEYLHILQNYIGGSISQKRTVWPTKPAWRLTICGNYDVYTLLKQIEKHLPIKKEQAKMIMEFCILRMDISTRKTVRNMPYQNRVWELVEIMRKLNKKGLRP